MSKTIPELSLTLHIETQPVSAQQIVFDAFDDAYKGERAATEDKGDFALRKIEEYIQAIIAKFYLAKEHQNLRLTEKKIFAGIGIRSKPETSDDSPTNPGENDPTMMPGQQTISRNKNPRRKRK